MSWWSIILLPLISAFIGWITNWVAIKMLFHPKEPVRVLGITFHGIFPKRQKQFAEKLGKLVSNELLSFSDIEQKITSPDNLKKIMPVVEKHVDEFLHAKLKEAFPMIAMFIGEKTISQLKTLFMNELESIFPVLMKSYMINLQQELDLEAEPLRGSGLIATCAQARRPSLTWGRGTSRRSGVPSRARPSGVRHSSGRRA